MANMRPILAGEHMAAKLLDMTLGDFRGLVECGALPGPAVWIADKFPRWSVADLEAIATGAVLQEDFSW